MSHLAEQKAAVLALMELTESPVVKRQGERLLRLLEKVNKALEERRLLEGRQ